MKNAFSSGKKAWASTMQTSEQNKRVIPQKNPKMLTPKQKSLVAGYGGKFPKTRDKTAEAKAMLGQGMRGEKY